jgi:hypothetical protein
MSQTRGPRRGSVNQPARVGRLPLWPAGRYGADGGGAVRKMPVTSGAVMGRSPQGCRAPDAPLPV